MLSAFLTNYLSITVLIAVVLLCLGFVIAVLRAAYAQEKKFESKEEKTLSQYKSILVEAHDSARKILTEAAENAAKLNLQTEKSNQEIEQQVNTLFKNALQTFVTQSQQDLTTMRTDFKKEMDTMFHDIKTLAEQDVTTVQKTLLSQTVDIHDTIAKKAEEAFTQLQNELAEYKKLRMKSVDAEVDRMVITVSRQFLERVITPSDHGKLILDALEAAKKEGLVSDAIV